MIPTTQEVLLTTSSAASSHHKPSSSSSLSASQTEPSVTDNLPPKPPPKNRRRRPKGAAQQKKKKNANRARARNRNNNNNSTGTAASLHLYGNYPDVYWRSISMDHLRLHPHFDPLPHPPPPTSTIDSMEDTRKFRQGSWQWDALHVGRCTTSQALAALGFVQPHVARQFHIPRSWLPRTPYEHLQDKGMETVEDMRRELLLVEEEAETTEKSTASTVGSEELPLTTTMDDVWKTPDNSDSSSSFVADYLYTLTDKDRQHRFDIAKTMQKASSTRPILTTWGSVQEATTLLILLNHFRTCRIEEVGLCAAQHNTLLLGATPDGLLRHPNGTVEAVEVKSHCPFVPSNGRHKRRQKFAVHGGGFGPANNNNNDDTAYVFPYHVPQLQLELYCADCPSVLLVRSTARHGALIVRMHRDEAWMDEMLYWMERFQHDFVLPRRPPPPNFFYDAEDAEDRERYRAFVASTLRVRRERVELVARVSAADIQRMGPPAPFFLDRSVQAEADNNNNKEEQE